MQEVQVGHHPGPGPARPDQATGVLQDPDEVGLYIRGRRIARLEPETFELEAGLVLDSRGIRIEYDLVSSERLFWDPVPALLFLQGGTMVQVLEPRHFILLRGVPVPAENPRPGMTGVRIASIHRAPALQPQLLFEALLRQNG